MSCASFEAHSSMPWLVTPRILRGLRLHSTVTRAPSIASSGTNATSPLQICRGSASPTSTSSTYRLSASGCFQHLVMRPTLMSITYGSTSSAAAAPASTAGADADAHHARTPSPRARAP